VAREIKVGCIGRDIIAVIKVEMENRFESRCIRANRSQHD
jgi:hypothetical protein